MDCPPNMIGMIIQPMIIEENDYALIILDLMLPKVDGLEVCKRIRAKTCTRPS